MVEDFWQDGGVKNEVKDKRNKKYDFKNKAEASWIYYSGHEGILFVRWFN